MATNNENKNISEQDFRAAMDRTDTPLYARVLKRPRSLSNRGFAFTILFTASAFCLPLFAFLGTFALWAMFPFVALATAALWYFIRRNDKDGSLSEDIRIWPDLIAVHRYNPRKPDQFWLANPYWVSAHIKSTKRIDNYVTLKGAGREIELGAFLTPEIRKELYRDLLEVLAKANRS